LPRRQLILPTDAVTSAHRMIACHSRLEMAAPESANFDANLNEVVSQERSASLYR